MSRLTNWWNSWRERLLPVRGIITTAAVLSLLIGFSAGIVGELFARGVILPYVVSDTQLIELNNTFYTLLAKYNFLNQNEQSGPVEIVIRRGNQEPTVTTPIQVAAGAIRDQLASASVSFFAAIPTGNDPLLSAYLPAEQLGRGFVVTNDGWLLTTEQVIGSRRNLVAVISGTAYPVETVVADPLSPWVFVKVTGQNLPVMPLARSGQPQIGDIVHGLLAGQVVSTNAIAQTVSHTITARRDLVRSTEVFTARYQLLTPPPSDLSGDPLVNVRGEVIGALVIIDGAPVVLPLTNITRQIDQVLRDRTIERVTMGISYVLLEELWQSPEVAVAEYGGLKRGALVYRNTGLGFAGVRPRSPAAAADLQTGDVITRVDGEEVSADRDLTEIVQSRPAGSTVTLTIWRNGEMITVPVMLEKLAP